MKKQRQTKRKKETSSLILLLLLAVILIASTYAWFTSNQSVRVDQLEVNVEAKNGLQISTDALNWKSILTTQDLEDSRVAATYSTHTNQIPKVMEPVSTGGNVADGRLDMFYGVAEPDPSSGEFTLEATKQVDTRGTNGKYIAFDLFLQVNAQTKINIGQDSSVVAVGSSKGLENGARIALLKQGHVEPGAAHTTAQALNGGTTSDLFLWEPNSDVHTPAGVTNALSVYGKTTTETGAQPLPYFGIIAPFTKGDGVKLNNTNEQATYFKAVTPNLKTPKQISADQDYLTLEAGVTKIRVYMWVEGEDVDTENNASGSDIGYNLQFNVAQQ